MPTTPVFEIPYPGPGDPNNPPVDFYALAAWLEDNFPSSGTYTPTLTPATNADSATASAPWMWTRIGDIVTVDGPVNIDPTATGLVTVRADLPVASNLAASTDLSGVMGSSAGGQVGTVVAHSVLHVANISFVATGTTGINFGIHFAYRVI